MIKVRALRFIPVGRSYEVSPEGDRSGDPGYPISQEVAHTSPRTLGGEPLWKTALRYPGLWSVVHPSTPWEIKEDRNGTV